MKTLTITTKAKATAAQVQSLFKPENGRTLERGRYGRGKYKNNLRGRTLDVPDHVFSLWTEPRQDADGPYFALFAMMAPFRAPTDPEPAPDPEPLPPSAAVPKHTANGFDPLWVTAINHVLEDRGGPVRISDVSELLWEKHIGPMIDALEDGKIE